MKIGALIIARLSSKRLPNKNIMKILNRPMIDLMIERVQASENVDQVIIATSDQESDDSLEQIANELNIGCYRGSLNNVMERITCAADFYNVDTIVELLGDNPLVHSSLIDAVIEKYKKENFDYCATLTKEYTEGDKNSSKLFSIGLRVQVYSKDAAKKFNKYPDYINNSSKHPSAFIFDHPDMFNIGFVEANDKWLFANYPDYTFAVNYKKNFKLIETIFEQLYPKKQNYSLEDLYFFLTEHPQLLDLMGEE